MKSSIAFIRAHVLPAVVCFAVAIAVSGFDTLERVEFLTLDHRTRYRADHQAPPDPRVAIVGVDDFSLAETAFGHWPWPRSVHGGFLYLLSQVKPAVVAWDFLFTERDAKDPNNDAFLLAGLKAANFAVVFGARGTDLQKPPNAASITPALTQVEGDRNLIPSAPFADEPLPEFAALARMGFVDTARSSDGFCRHADLLIRIGDRVYPSLALQAMLAFWKVPPEHVRVRLGDAITFSDGERQRRVPIDERGRYFINYRRGAEPGLFYRYYTVYQGLERRAAGQPAPDLPDLAGKILFVGQVSTALSDVGPTPFSALSPLVLVHVNAVENILRDDFVVRPPAWLVWTIAFAVSVLGLGLFSKRKYREQVVFSVGVPAIYVLVAYQVWDSFSVWLPLVGPLLGFTLVQVFMVGRRVLQEQRAKAEIKGMFGAYVSPTVVSRLIESGQKPQLGGHEAEITAFFSDIQGFSAFSEILPPDKLVALMNEYLTACTDIVQDEGGTLDKYIGDAIVAMFGAPVALPDHAFRACVATQRVQTRLAELREKWKADGNWPEIVCKMQTRIGLNTGPAIIGNMGSRARFTYTMMGDNVNLAARMESGAKQWGAYTMCTEATKLACEQHGRGRVVFRALGRIKVMGRRQAVPIFEVVGLSETITPTARECIGLFEAALEKYHAREWDAAGAGFARSAELEPNQPGKTPGVKSNPSLIFAALAEAYRTQPPALAWDGVHVMTEK